MRFASPPRNSDGGNVPTFHAKWTWTVKTTGASGERLAKLWRSSCGANDHWEMDKIQILENCSFCCQHKVMGTLDARPCLGKLCSALLPSWKLWRAVGADHLLLERHICYHLFSQEWHMELSHWQPLPIDWKGIKTGSARSLHNKAKYHNMDSKPQGIARQTRYNGVEYTVHNFKPFDSVYSVIRQLTFSVEFIYNDDPVNQQCQWPVQLTWEKRRKMSHRCAGWIPQARTYG